MRVRGGHSGRKSLMSCVKEEEYNDFDLTSEWTV